MAAAMINPPDPVERKWRVGPPTSGVPGSLYDFVRHHLCAHGGTCLRQELLEALESDPAMNVRLAKSRGFSALITNMRHSGDIVIDDQTITATPRTVRRMGARM